MEVISTFVRSTYYLDAKNTGVVKLYRSVYVIFRRRVEIYHQSLNITASTTETWLGRDFHGLGRSFVTLQINLKKYSKLKNGQVVRRHIQKSAFILINCKGEIVWANVYGFSKKYNNNKLVYMPDIFYVYNNVSYAMF